MNVALNLYGQEFLLALLGEPEAAQHDLRVITETINTMHRWFQMHVPPSRFQPPVAIGRWQPPGFGQICGCSTHLLSPDTYRIFIAPLDEEILSLYPRGGLIHLCGDHTRHIATWRAISAFRAFQLNDGAADDFEHYFHGLRDDQIIYLNPTATMIAERALDISGGRRLVLVTDP